MQEGNDGEVIINLLFGFGHTNIQKDYLFFWHLQWCFYVTHLWRFKDTHYTTTMTTTIELKKIREGLRVTNGPLPDDIQAANEIIVEVDCSKYHYFGRSISLAKEITMYLRTKYGIDFHYGKSKVIEQVVKTDHETHQGYIEWARVRFWK